MADKRKSSQDVFMACAPASSRTGDNGAGSSECPVKQGTPALAASCPGTGVNPSNNMISESNKPLRGQRSDLDDTREASSIPIADPQSLPAHQSAEGNVPAGDKNWVYPSEQMFFNAMKRKGWNPSEADMKSVVNIHNAVNEQAWQHVLHWERLHEHHCKCPKLIRFQGRPKDLSPKALLLNALGYKLPFDRHDWYVDRCGQEVRYVIDFYSGNEPQGSTGSGMFLDVRPALDSIGAFADRARMTVITMLSQL